MAFFKKLHENLTVNTAYVEPYPSDLLDALQKQEQGKEICVLCSERLHKQKRTLPIREDALKVLQKCCNDCGRSADEFITVGLRKQTYWRKDRQQQAVDWLCDRLSVFGAAVCEQSVPNERQPVWNGVFLYCNGHRVLAENVVIRERKRSVRFPWC